MLETDHAVLIYHHVLMEVGVVLSGVDADLRSRKPHAKQAADEWGQTGYDVRLAEHLCDIPKNEESRVEVQERGNGPADPYAGPIAAGEA
jgi:hypothetical protein